VRRLYFAIPGDIETPTGGYAYDRRVMALLPDLGVDVLHLPLPGGFPFPSEAELRETADLLAGVTADAAILADGLAFGAMPESLLSGVRAPVAVLLHHPLGLETGLSEAQSRALLDTERRALRHARHVIVTSKATAATLAGLGFAPPPPVTVAEPGTLPAGRAAGSSGGSCRILCVGAVVPRKAQDVLVEALARLTHLNWRCTIAGSLDRDSDFAASLIRRIEDAGLAGRINLTGPLDAAALDALYTSADIFALPSRYEGYGMVFAEALARGLPIVAARAGAVPDVVPPDAGLLVPPDDAAALAGALAGLIADPALRAKMSDAAWAHGQKLPRWEDTARTIAAVVTGLGQ
jgi:glycosyltransferase involved in cell wall biosynthesis